MCYRVQPTFPKPLMIFFSKFSIFHYFKKWVPQSLFSWILTKKKEKKSKILLSFWCFHLSARLLVDVDQWVILGGDECMWAEGARRILFIATLLPPFFYLSSSLPGSYCLSPPLIITPRLLLLQTFFPNLLLHHILPSSFHQYILSSIKSTNNDALHCYDFFWHPHI